MTPRPEVTPEAKDLTLMKTSPRTRWIWLRPRGRFQVWTMKIRLLLIPTPTTRFSNKPRPSRIEGRRPLFLRCKTRARKFVNDEWSWWRMTSLFPDLPACFLDECFRTLLGPALAWLIVTYWNVNKREKNEVGLTEINPVNSGGHQNVTSTLSNSTLPFLYPYYLLVLSFVKRFSKVLA